MKIENILNIEGRGEVAVVHLDQDEEFPKQGQEILINDSIRKIRGVEEMRGCEGQRMRYVGLLI